MRDIGKMIRHMVLGSTHTSMEQSMRETGMRISNMEKVKKLGQIRVNMMGNTNMVRKMDMESMNGQMEAVMRDNGRIIRLMDLGSMFGVMVVHMREHG